VWVVCVDFRGMDACLAVCLRGVSSGWSHLISIGRRDGGVWCSGGLWSCLSSYLSGRGSA